MKLITAIVRPEKLEAIREGLEAYGVQGLTVSAASGYGRQRGYTEVYRGAEYNVDLLPKIRVEVLATDEQADDILDRLRARYGFQVMFDGGINTVTIARIRAKYVVAASAVLKAADPVRACHSLRTGGKYERRCA